MPTSDSDRIAVLIDADNTSPKHARALLEEVAKYGVATVKRAYGDWTGTQLNGWKAALNELAVQPMQQFAYTTGKNSTDSALIIDAMDLLYSGNVDTFAIVSSDSDFTRLATRLRESGKTVIGLGLRKTPKSLVSACDRFVYLELLERDEQPAAEVDAAGDAAGQAPATLPDLRRLLTTAVDAASYDDGWALLSSVANQINRSNPSFDVRAYGEPKLMHLVRAQDYLDVEQPESGGVRVRLRPRGTAKKAAAKKPATDKTPAEKTPAKKATARKDAAPATVAAPEPVVAIEPEPVAPKVTTRRRSDRA